MNKKSTKIFIISGPSGVGEDSVIKGVMKKIKMNRVITTVTRKKRKGEKQGLPYYFVTTRKFKKMAAENAFIEKAMVYGNYRGCTKKEINRLLKLKKPIIWKVDWQGVKSIKKIIPSAIAIFIAPPSYEILAQRLTSRGQDSIKTIKKREKFSREWLKHKNIYNYQAINRQGKLEKTINQVVKIIKAEILRG